MKQLWVYPFGLQPKVCDCVRNSNSMALFPATSHIFLKIISLYFNGGNFSARKGDTYTDLCYYSNE